MTLAQPFLIALVVSAILVPIFRAIALRLGYIGASPVGAVDGVRDRVPLKAPFGGVAIAITVFGGAVAIGAVQTAGVLLLCGGALFLIGLTSDLFPLKPSTKAVALIAVASVVLFFDLRMHWSESVTLDSIVTVFWIVGITSAFNLLDRMDGLCGGVALIAGVAFLLTVVPVDPASDVLLRTQYLSLLFGAVAGFLIYNLHPARAALGESGSLFIGLNMAAMTLHVAPGRGSNLLSVIAVPILLLLIPILDMSLVALARMRAGPGGDGQSSHRLVAIGLSERTAVAVLWTLAAASGLIAVLADRGDQGIAGLVAVLFTIGLALVAVYVMHVQVYENVDPLQLPRTITPLGAGAAYRRRIAEVCLDLVLVSAAYYGAFRLLFYDGAEFADRFRDFSRSLPIVLATQMVALFAMGAYQGIWRYFALADGLTIAKAVFAGTVTSHVVIVYLQPLDAYAPSVFAIYAMAAALLLATARASFRVLGEFVRRRSHGARRLVIYGASDTGVTAVRHLMEGAGARFRVVGFIDDDPSKWNVRVHGYTIIGGYDHLVGMIMSGEIDAVSMANDGSETIGLATLCAAHGVTLHRLSIDWREIPATEAAAGGGGAVALSTESRVVPFGSARRERESATQRFPRVVPPLPAASSAPIRVVHIITRLILGGAQENTLYTAIGQHHDPRFDVTLLCGVDEAGEGNMYGQATAAGLNVVVLPSLVREIRPLTDVKALLDVYRFLRQGAFTIVHTHSSKAGIIGRLAARAAGVPIVVHTLHGLVFHEFQSAWRNRIYVSLKRLCAPLTDTIISVSDRVAQTALDRGIGRPDQHVTIFSGIELDRFLSVRDRLSVEEAKARAEIPASAPVVGKIARLFPLKGHVQFLEMAAEIARRMPDVWFLLVGDGPLRDELQAEAQRLGIADRLVMVGRVPPDRVPEFIQAMDVVVHTSLREGIARVLPQAGAVGKPVVTFDLDGAPEVVHDGVSGYLVPPVDTARVAERVVELLGDPGRRRAFGDAGRAFAAEHFAVERMVERINGVYLALVAQRACLTQAAGTRAPL